MTKLEVKNLYDTYFDHVRRFLYYRSCDKQLATDIAQDAFMKLWEKQLLPDKGKEKALLFKIANDMFITKYRKLSREVELNKKITFSLKDVSPEDELHYNEIQKKFEDALSQLSEKNRTVFLMSRIDNLKYYEIAQQLDISVKAVEKRMKTALDFFRKTFANNYIILCVWIISTIIWMMKN